MDKALQTMIDNMPEKTGKSLEEWKQILLKVKFEKHIEGANFLKKEYGLTHGFANTIFMLSKDTGASDDELLTFQYKGKEQLLPIYKRLKDVINSLGQGVKIVPKKGSVSMIRKRQFTLIKPATKTRIDLGLKLAGKEITNRLEGSGPFGTMCTHRVKITSIDEVDQELIGWIKEAYEQAS